MAIVYNGQILKVAELNELNSIIERIKFQEKYQDDVLLVQLMTKWDKLTENKGVDNKINDEIEAIQETINKYLQK